jgi:hypothetical protein
MNDYDYHTLQPYVDPFPWLSAILAAFALVAYPVAVVGLCLGWW